MVHRGRDVTALPLVERKARLAKLLDGVPRAVLVLGDFPAEAVLFEQVVMALELEGFVAKRKTSTYQPGPERSRDWLKIKPPEAEPPQRS